MSVGLQISTRESGVSRARARARSFSPTSDTRRKMILPRIVSHRTAADFCHPLSPGARRSNNNSRRNDFRGPDAAVVNSQKNKSAPDIKRYDASFYSPVSLSFSRETPSSSRKVSATRARARSRRPKFMLSILHKFIF